MVVETKAAWSLRVARFREAGHPLLVILAFFGLAVKLHLLTAALDNAPHPGQRAATEATVALLLLFLATLSWLSPRLRLASALVLNGLVTSLALGDVLRYRFFGDVLSIAEFTHVWQLGHVGSSVLALLRPSDWLYFLDLLVVLAAWQFGVRAPRHQRQAMRAQRAGPALLLLAGVAFGIPALRLVWLDPEEVFEYSATRREVAVAIGILPYHLFDAINHISYPALGRLTTTEAERTAVREFLNGLERREHDSELFGVAQGRNVILIMSESLQAFPVGLVVEDQLIAPGLSRFASESLSFVNFYDQTHAGTTSDGEFTSLQSLHPLPAGVVATRYPANDFHGLPAILASHGYRALSASAESGDFWNKRQMHPRLGFAEMYFGDRFQFGEVLGLGLADSEFFGQTSRIVSAQPEPFLAFLITLSNHHPYKLPVEHRSLRLGSLEGTLVGDYLHSVHYYDQVFTRFIEELRQSGMLDRSVVIVYGDHQAFWQDVPQLPGLLGFDPDDAFREWQTRKRLVLSIRLPGGAHAGVRTGAAGHLDIAPTVLSLLGVSREGEVLMGRDLTSSEAPFVVLRDGSFVTDSHGMIASGGASHATCRDLHSGAAVDCGGLKGDRDRARERLRMSDLVIRGNLIPELRRRNERLRGDPGPLDGSSK